MKPSDIRELPIAELKKKERDNRERLLQLRLQKNTGQVEDTAEIRKLRRDIARMNTILRQKEIAGSAA